MTKRGTEYELFVKQVYENLNHADGLTDVQIQHDVKLTGVAGVEHQIDVFWTFKRGGVDYRVVVECKDYNRKVSLEKIKAFHALLHDLGNVRGVFATRVGFQSGAREYALKYGIQLMEIRHPTDDDWQGRLRNIHLNMKMRLIGEIEAHYHVDKDRMREMGISLPKDDSQCYITGQARIDFKKMIANDNPIKDEGSISPDELVRMLPVGEPQKGNRYSFEFKDGMMHFAEYHLPIDKIEYVYNTYETENHVAIRGDDVIKAIVKNITDGSEQTIDQFGGVRDRVKIDNRE